MYGMKRLMLAAVFCAAASSVEAQNFSFPQPITGYTPTVQTITVARPMIGSPLMAAPTVTYMPAAPVLQPYSVARPAVSYSVPANPVVTYRAPVAYGAPVVTYRVPVNYGAPVVTYRPPAYVAPAAVIAPVAPVVPVMVGRPVIVRPKIYVPGQPLRNLFRAVTP